MTLEITFLYKNPQFLEEFRQCVWLTLPIIVLKTSVFIISLSQSFVLVKEVAEFKP